MANQTTTQPPIKTDAATQKRIDVLHPKIREQVRALVAKANALLADNIQVRIVQGLRTFAEQDALYAQGRTKAGAKVTNAKGGQSVHNYGLAIDFCLLINGKEISWDTKKDADRDNVADWIEVVNVFTRAGFSWGGNWRTFKDLPHLEATFGNTWRTLLAQYNAGNFITGTKYVNI